MPPQRFSVLTGTFDCPEASTFTPAAIPTRRPSIHRNFDPYLASTANERSATTPQQSGMERVRHPGRLAEVTNLRQRIIDLHQRVHSVSTASRAGLPSDHSSSAQSQYVRPSSLSSNLQRHRLRRQREDDAFGTVQDVVDRLNEATSDLTSILDEPLPQIVTSDEFVESLLADTPYLGRRHKRRKLDGDPLDQDPAPVYGHYGQVVPGRLKMNLMSCDGGQLPQRDGDLFHRRYWPENILSNDKSVYCTERDHCNIILRHWKETPFTVTKIVIKAPEVAFTAPVQEGLIFVSMNSENLLSRTKRYRIRNSPLPQHSVYPESQGQHARPSRENRAVPPTWSQRFQSNDARPPSRRQQFQAYTMGSNETPPYMDESSNDELADFLDLDCDQQGTQTLPNNVSHAPGYHVVTTFDDPSGDEEDPSSDDILYDRQRRRTYGPDGFSSDDDGEPIRRRHRRQISPRKIELESSTSSGDSSAVHEALMPHARFFIDMNKHMVSVKFDPPITGRYVLVKLWSPQDHDNIDIQSISVYGYAGNRFIPSIKMK